MATKLGTRTRDRNVPPAPPRTRSDAYVGMLALALIAQIAGAAFLWLDWSSYPDKAPRPPDARPAAGTKAPDLPPPVDKGGVDKGGADKGGMDKGGMDKGGMDKGGMDKGGMDKAGMDKAGMGK